MKLPKTFKDSERNMDFREHTPLHAGWQVVGWVTGGQLEHIMDVRFYWGRGACKCIVWVHSQTVSSYGIGKAGGCGYHHESAAFSSALQDMGVSFNADDNPAMKGDGYIDSTLQKMAKALGYRTWLVTRWGK